MAEIFDINRVEINDPLREKKINALNSIKNCLQGIDNKIELEILQKALPEIIQDYSENWYRKLLKSATEKEVGRVQEEVERTISKRAKYITEGLIWFREDDISDKSEIGNLFQRNHGEKGDVTIFDAKYPPYWEFKSVGGSNKSDQGFEIAKKILRNVLLARTDKNKKIKEHDLMFKEIMDNLRGSEFRFLKGRIREGRIRVFAASKMGYSVKTFKNYMKGPGMIGSNKLKDELLPKGQKKADLLQELERVIESGINRVNIGSSWTNQGVNDVKPNPGANNNVNLGEASSDTEVSSIFDEGEDGATTDNSSISSSNDNSANKESTPNNSSAENDEYVQTQRNKLVKRVKEYLSKLSIEENELEGSNRDWLEKIMETNDHGEMFSIVCKVEIDAKKKKSLKKTAVALDNIIEDVPALFENQSTSNEGLNKTFQTLNESLGEEKNEVKAQQAKKTMIDHDPEKYFDSFIKWVEEEEKKIEEEKKKLKETDTDSKIEYDEEEKLFLAGQISDQKKKEEIAERIEKKINIKAKSLGILKWSIKWAKWLKEKAWLLRKNNQVGFEQKKEQIKQEIENIKNSSNQYIRQAYAENKNCLNNLLSGLDAISQKSQTVAPEKRSFHPEVMVPVSIALLTIAAAILVIRRRKSNEIRK